MRLRARRLRIGLAVAREHDRITRTMTKGQQGRGLIEGASHGAVMGGRVAACRAEAGSKPAPRPLSTFPSHSAKKGFLVLPGPLVGGGRESSLSGLLPPTGLCGGRKRRPSGLWYEKNGAGRGRRDAIFV